MTTSTSMVTSADAMAYETGSTSPLAAVLLQDHVLKQEGCKCLLAAATKLFRSYPDVCRDGNVLLVGKCPSQGWRVAVV